MNTPTRILYVTEGDAYADSLCDDSLVASTDPVAEPVVAPVGMPCPAVPVLQAASNAAVASTVSPLTVRARRTVRTIRAAYGARFAGNVRRTVASRIITICLNTKVGSC
jgi:hypothetical protein